MPPQPPDLMEELVEEVLLRFPPDDPASLVRVTLVCKLWCRLVCGAAFRRRFSTAARPPCSACSTARTWSQPQTPTTVTAGTEYKSSCECRRHTSSPQPPSSRRALPPAAANTAGAPSMPATATSCSGGALLRVMGGLISPSGTPSRTSSETCSSRRSTARVLSQVERRRGLRRRRRWRLRPPRLPPGTFPGCRH